MSQARQEVSVWLTHPLNGLPLVFIGWVGWAFVVATTEWMQPQADVYFVVGGGLVPLMAALWSWPERLAFDGDRLIRTRPLGSARVMEVAGIKSVDAMYEPGAGPTVSVAGATPYQVIRIASGPLEAGLLLRRLGRSLELRGLTHVIANEGTRRALGIPGGGLRDPWMPKRTFGPCPTCEHDALEHPGSPVAAAVDGACAECVHEQRQLPRRQRSEPCRWAYAAWVESGTTDRSIPRMPADAAQGRWTRRWQNAGKVPTWGVLILVVAAFFAWMAQDGRSAYAAASRFHAEGVAVTATGSHVFLEQHFGGRVGSDLVGTKVRVDLPGRSQPVPLEWVRDRTTETSIPVEFRTGWFPGSVVNGYAAPLPVHVLSRDEGTVVAMADEDMAIWLEDPGADDVVLGAAASLAGLTILLLLMRRWLIVRATHSPPDPMSRPRS